MQEHDDLVPAMTELTHNVGLDPVVLLAADEAFAMPLAVTVRSVLDNLAPDRKLEIYILDGGITPATKERLLKSWPDTTPYSLHWVQVDEGDLAGIEPAEHWNVVAYYRLLLPRILPLSVHRVIYLDSDIIVRTDLGKMWDCDLAGNACMAIQDSFAPYVDSSVALANFERARPYLCKHPIRNFQDLGLPPETPYFNSGILLLDLSVWRELDLPTKMIECLHRNREHVRWTDQYALNVSLRGRWGLLDQRWNQGAQVFVFPSWRFSPWNKQTLQAVRNDPYIVHFTTSEKPWHANSRHPYRREFFHYLDRTDWAGWRPADDKTWAYWWKVQKGAARLAYENCLLRLRAR
jgi:lipopolysaccharide biosynthesis glycosyltransferase